MENAEFHWISQQSPFFCFALMSQFTKHVQTSPSCLLELKLFTVGAIALKLMSESH